jgi:outer membrane protein OmpA-like peptidoglycan-associated protein
MLRKFNKLQFFTLVFAASMLLGVASIFAQDAQLRTLTAGQKYKIEGVVVATDSNSFLLRDATGIDTKVLFTPGVSIKSNSFWGGGDRYPATSIVRGLNLKAEGRGDSSGALAATKIRFDKSDLEVARTVDSRVTPAEDRITKAEQNAERLSGQIDELVAVSNAARGGAKAAQETADAAVAGVNATNKRITDLDEYVVQSSATVNFRVNSSILSPEAKLELDNVATAAKTLRGYTIEVTGYASSDGDPRANKILSEKRAKAVVEYLIDTHDIPLRRIGTSYGYGENKAIADNSTLEGRRANRRVEVRLLVSRGLNQNVEVRPATTDSNDDGTR